MINEYVLKMKKSKLREINELAIKYDNVLKLTLGEPHFEACKEIKRGVYEELDKGISNYSLKGGTVNAKESIKKYIRDNFLIDYNIDEMIITNGASMGLTSVLKTIINKDDEVIIIAPAYPVYEELIKLFGGVVITVDSSISNFRLDVEELSKKITNKTKAIIINYPNNPTGVSLSNEEQKKLVSLTNESDLFLISDEVYNKINYNSEFLSMGVHKEIKEKLIIVNSFSKSHAIPGYRIGFVLASKHIIRYIKDTNHYFNSSVSNLSMATLKYINDISLTEMINHYKTNCSYLIDKLDVNNIDYIKPEGTFYLFVDISKTNKKSLEFIKELLMKYQVLVIPGIVFGKQFDNYIRLSYACEKDLLIRGTNALIEFIS